MRDTPYSNPVLLDNPLFIRDLRMVHHAYWPDNIQRSTRRLILRTMLIMLGLIFALIGLTVVSDPRTYWQSPYSLQNLVRLLEYLIGVLVGICVLITPLVDFLVMQASVGSFSQEINKGRLDLLRLTPLTNEAIIAAKYTVTQLHVWRITVMAVSIRLLASSLFLLSTFYFPMLTYNSNRILLPARSSSVLIMGCILLVWIVYVIEPLWRIRAVTALGVLISTFSSNYLMSLLAGGGIVLLLILTQVIILSGYSYAFVNFLNAILYPLSTDYGSELRDFVGMSLIFLAGLILAVIIRVFYARLGRWSVSYSVRSIGRLS